MKFKNGVFMEVQVYQNGVREQLVPSEECHYAMKVADEVSLMFAKKEAVITSILDGTHGKHSLHYIGDAFDMRTFIYSHSELSKIVQELTTQLGSNYDVVLESDHIHIEYDPKYRT